MARLFQKTFRDNRAPAAAIEAQFHALLFEHPWRDPEVTSKVSIAADGTLDGFVGVLPARMSLTGRPLRAALATSLMVESPHANPLVGARLLRGFFQGPQELSFGETSNAIATRMWERLGGRAVPPFSMEWIRVLRPLQAGLAFASMKYPRLGWLRPAAALADRTLPLVAPPARLERVTTRVEEVSDSDPELLDLMARLASRYRLGPRWDHASLVWFLRHAAYKERYGALVRGIVRTTSGRPLGCVLYCARPGGIGLVLQILAEPGQVGAVVDALLDDAYGRGCAALRGRTQPDLLGALQSRQCLFLCRSSLTVHSRDADVMAAVSSGDALVTGVAGETWTRLVGGLG